MHQLFPIAVLILLAGSYIIKRRTLRERPLHRVLSLLIDLKSPLSQLERHTGRASFPDNAIAPLERKIPYDQTCAGCPAWG